MMESRPAAVAALPRSSEALVPSAVSWAAIFAGAAGAAALSLILLVLGTGLGFTAMSPWSGEGASAVSIGMGSIVWLLLMAIAASGLGGYLAGRLRVKWQDVHADEIHFRDTAHGLLAWAVATLLTAALLTSTIGSVLGGGAKAAAAATAGTGAAAAAAGGLAASAAQPGPGGSGLASSIEYYSDALFRPAAPSAGASAVAPSAEPSGAAGDARIRSAETGRIVARSLQSGALSAEDKQYLGQLVAQRTGLSQQDAEKRVTDTYSRAQAAMQDAEAKAKAAADQARKAAAWASLWVFVSLLLGAFTSSLCATFGGRQRDF